MLILTAFHANALHKYLVGHGLYGFASSVLVSDGPFERSNFPIFCSFSVTFRNWRPYQFISKNLSE